MTIRGTQLAMALASLALACPNVAHADGDHDRSPDAPPRFSRHVAAVFSRLGCNGGTCHGAVKGQNGFRLALFGADPASITTACCANSAAGGSIGTAPQPACCCSRRPARSPMAAASALEVGSPEYNMLCRWIAAGAPLDEPAPIATRPSRRHASGHDRASPGETYRLRVEATFADGSTEDVTSLCGYDVAGPPGGRGGSRWPGHGAKGRAMRR